MTIQTVANAVGSSIGLTQGVDRLTSQYASEQAALSSGVTADNYADLGDQRYQALDLQPQITQQAAYQQNVTSAQNTLKITQTAMTQITTIATNLQTSLTSLQGDSSSTNVATAALQARQSLTQLASLLNTSDGSGFVFAGTASDTAPITDPSAVLQSSFFTTIKASVASVGTSGAATVEDATLAAASTNTAGSSIFSPALSVSASAASALGRTVAVGQQNSVAVGFVATGGGSATDTSTGSSIRDLMRALATVGSLDGADVSSAGFTTLVDDTSKQMTSVGSSLTLTTAAIGQTQSELTAQTSSLSLMSDALTAQLGLVKDSDAASLSTQLTDTQNQLQASYSLIADMKGMSLADYI